MMKLFADYRDAGKYTEALLIGRNLFNKNSGDVAVFDAYFNLLCSQAQFSVNTIAERRQFISQSEVALAFFSENVELDAVQIEKIKAYEAKLTAIVKAFNEEIDQQNALTAAAISKKNDESLHVLERLLNKLKNLGKADKQEFEKVLGHIGEIDQILDKTAFSPTQQKRYDKLTKQCAETVNKLLAVFERSANVDYNQRAITAFKRVFDFFKGNQYDNKNSEEMIKNFFAFDASRLFNETLVYYNHVYSYILSKMDDDEKFTLTQAAVISEKREG